MVVRRGRRREAREGRWHRGEALDGDWQLRWTEAAAEDKSEAGWPAVSSHGVAGVSASTAALGAPRAQPRAQQRGAEAKPWAKRAGQYVGAVQLMRPHGEGVCKYPSDSHGGGGGVFTGAWAHGLRSGFGTCVWGSGTDYSGLWEVGRIAGQVAPCRERGAPNEQGTRQGTRQGGVDLTHIY